METNDDDKKKDIDNSKNLFRIMDQIIDQLNNTKRLFIAMILTVMILPPAVFVITFELLESDASSLHSFEMSHQKNEHRDNFFLRHNDLLFLITRNVPLIIGILWLGIGIRQWIVLSKWNKKYQKYKELQKKIDKEIGDKNDDSFDNTHMNTENNKR
jgi:hypothetical protein